MPLGQYLTGLLFYIPTTAAALASAYLLTRRFYRHLPLLPRWLALAMLSAAGVLIADVVPAALGALSRTSALLTAALLLAVVTAATRRSRPYVTDRDPPPPRSGVVSIAIATAAVGCVTVYALARLRAVLAVPITDVDMLGFHLPGIARFIQTGTIWRVDQFLPGFATAQYPDNGDFLILSTILPWRDLAFVRLLPALFYALAGVATYVLALELRASRAAAATMGAAAVIVPALSLLAFDGLPDAISLATLASGLVFLIRHTRCGRTSDLVLAGLALGLSFGTKWYTATAVALIYVVWLAGRLLLRPGRPRVGREAAGLLSVILLGGGIWLLRNLVESGNPIYPKSVSLFGWQLFG